MKCFVILKVIRKAYMCKARGPWIFMKISGWFDYHCTDVALMLSTLEDGKVGSRCASQDESAMTALETTFALFIFKKAANDITDALIIQRLDSRGKMQ